MAPSHTRQTFAAHIDELRYRITWSVLALLAGSALGYYLRDHLLNLLSAPLGLPLYYTSPGGGFSLIIQLCLGFGLAVSVPVIVFHLLRFVAPILPSYSLKLLISILACSTLLVMAGVLFAYFVSLPAALYFLSEFSTEQVRALISTDTYISFVSIYLVGFAVLFQLPLLILLVNKITPLKPRTLLKHSRWVILAAAVIAAVLTPTPDPFNQMIMAGPMVGLYGLSIGLVGIANGVSKPKQGQAATIDDVMSQLSHKKLVAKTAASHKGRLGYLCTWEGKGWHADMRGTIVTFLHNGKHELISIAEIDDSGELVPNLFVDG